MNRISITVRISDEALKRMMQDKDYEEEIMKALTSDLGGGAAVFSCRSA